MSGFSITGFCTSRRQKRVEAEHGLELGDASGGVVANRVVGEAHDDSAARDEIVLAEPVVAEGIVDRQWKANPSSSTANVVLRAADLVVDPVVVASISTSACGWSKPRYRARPPG